MKLFHGQPCRPQQHQIGAGKGVGPAQRPHGNILCGPRSNAGKPHQTFDLALHIRGASQNDSAFTDGLHQRGDASGPAADDSERSDLVGRHLLESTRGRSQSIEFDVWRRNLGAEGARPTSRHRGRRLDRDLLAENGAHREFEAVESTRHTQAGQTTDDHLQL